MLEVGFLFHIALMIVVATLFAFITHYLRQPNIVGYIIAGIVIGPIGLSLIQNTNEIAALSELGIAFLLFGAGVEISFNKLKGVGKIAFLNGLLQVLLTIGISFYLLSKFQIGYVETLYIGTAIAFSSTMIVLKILADNYELATLHGRLMLGILIVQDVLAIIFISFLGNIEAGISLMSITTVLISAGILFIFGAGLNKFIFPIVLKVASRSQEILFLTAISTLFFFMGVANYLGFSIAIGALIGGISLSLFQFETEISGKLKALRDFFATIFFVSLGMQISLNLNSEMINLILVVLFLGVIAKPIILTLLHLVMGYGGRTSVSTGMGLGQMSEFSFIIALQGITLGYLSRELFTVITIPIIITIALTPYFFKYNHIIYDFFSWFRIKLNLPEYFFLRRRIPKTKKIKEKKLKKHIILFGAHRMGAEILNELNQKGELIIVDYDPEIIREYTDRGYNCIYGDMYNDYVLEKAHSKHAKLAIITTPDDRIILPVISKLKKMNNKIKIFTRANFTDDAINFYKAGADAVILPEMVAGKNMIRKINMLMGNNKRMKKSKIKHFERLLEEKRGDMKKFKQEVRRGI